MSSNFDRVICRRDFCFPDDNLRKYQSILTKLGTGIDMKELWFGIAFMQISSMFDRVICPQHDNGGVLWFTIFICYVINTVLLGYNTFGVHI